MNPGWAIFYVACHDYDSERYNDIEWTIETNEIVAGSRNLKEVKKAKTQYVKVHIEEKDRKQYEYTFNVTGKY